VRLTPYRDFFVTGGLFLEGKMLVMPKTSLRPYLVSSGGAKCCSVCQQVFLKDAKPSMRKAFAEHARKVHLKPREADNGVARE